MRYIVLIFAYFSVGFCAFSVKWNYPMSGLILDRMVYGSSPAVSDLGINSVGGEDDDCLEIIVGSDEMNDPFVNLFGIWRCMDAYGNMEWFLLTMTDESRSSPTIYDFWGNNGLGDSIPDIVSGTTSGWSVEAFSNSGSFYWRFGKMKGNGNFLWHSSPAVDDIVPSIPGAEIVIGCSNSGCPAVFCLEGDITDMVDNGISYDTISAGHSCWGAEFDSIGNEGIDWDVIWYYNTDAPIISSPAISDINSDGIKEIIVGTGWTSPPYWSATGFFDPGGKIICLNGATGTLEWEIQTSGIDSQVTASPAIADVDEDGDMEIFVGAHNGYFYCIDGDENSSGYIEPNEMAKIYLGGPIYSSAAVGDVDGDSTYEIIIAGGDGNLYCLNYDTDDDTITIEWQTHISDSIIFSSPAICAVGDSIPWPQFRHDPQRTGFYSPKGEIEHIFIGTFNGDLVNVIGDGTEIDRIHLNDHIVTSPVVADLDKDCYLDVVIVGAHGEFDDTCIAQDTLWCLGTSLPSGIGRCDTIPCDTMQAAIICPIPSFQYSSCENQEVIFIILFNTDDPIDTMAIFVSYTIEHGTGGTSSGQITEPDDAMSVVIVPPDTAFLIIDLPETTYDDEDTITISLDSIFSISGCKTIP